MTSLPIMIDEMVTELGATFISLEVVVLYDKDFHETHEEKKSSKLTVHVKRLNQNVVLFDDFHAPSPDTFERMVKKIYGAVKGKKMGREKLYSFLDQYPIHRATNENNELP